MQPGYSVGDPVEVRGSYSDAVWLPGTVVELRQHGCVRAISVGPSRYLGGVEQANPAPPMVARTCAHVRACAPAWCWGRAISAGMLARAYRRPVVALAGAPPDRAQQPTLLRHRGERGPGDYDEDWYIPRWVQPAPASTRTHTLGSAFVSSRLRKEMRFWMYPILLQTSMYRCCQ